MRAMTTETLSRPLEAPAPGAEMTLRDLAPGELAEVTGLAGSGSVFQRLCELGVVSGARVRLVRLAPFGDPIQIAVGSQHLSLRKAEAAMVRVTRANVRR